MNDIYRPSVSVCIATYNGSKFIESQLKSILGQLNDRDQIVVVDDNSTDNTYELITSLADSRFLIIKNVQNEGHVRSFERAISLAQNQYIFMSDQDDVWCDDRVEVMMSEILYSKALLVSTNSSLIDERGITINGINFNGVKANRSRSSFLNIFDIFLGKTSYFGCQMCLHRDILSFVVPIPSYVESHDLWIAMAANLTGRNRHLDYKSLLRRVHGGNASIIKRPLYQKLLSRIVFFLSMVHLFYRIKIHKSL